MSNTIDTAIILSTRRRQAAVLLLAALAALPACQSSSTNVVGPSGTKCGISVSAITSPIGPDGGPGTLAVTIAPECVWSAASEAEWIAITSSSNGQGSGTVGFVAAGNPTASSRRGAVLVGDRRVELVQSGAACQYSLTPPTAGIAVDGGESSVSVAAIPGCQWSAASQAPWLTILGADNGVGSGTIRFSAEPNDGAARSGTLTIADRTFAVNQQGTSSACVLTLARRDHALPAAGGTDTVTVSGPGECSWVAVSHASWITVAAGSAGAGNGAVSLIVGANPGLARVGVVTIAGQSYLITQTAAATGNCSYTIDAPGQTLGSAAGDGSVAVTTTPGCAWSAASHAPWITIASGVLGNGSGVVVLRVAQNTGAQRFGLLTVAGSTHVVTQQSGESSSCSYSLSATQYAAPAGGGTTSIGVTAGAGCPWSAGSQASWISVVSGASGSGNGSVGLSVASNGGAARSGTVTIAGHTFAVSQAAAAAPCSYSLGAAAQSVPAEGGAASVSVAAGSGCGWTSVSNAPWIAVTGGASGTGTGSVGLSVAANSGPQRTGTVTIAGQTHTIAQAARPAVCTYTLSPTTQSVALLGGDFSVLVTTQAGCSWTAVADDNWIQITSNASGSGSGIVSYRVSLALLSRSSRIVVAGEALTVNQRALLVTDGR